MLYSLTKKLEDPKTPLLGPNLKALRFFGVLLPDKLNVKNGTELGLAVVPSWVPWDKTKFSGYIAASLFQSYATIFGIGWISAFDATAIVIVVFFRVEIEVLRNDCGYIFGTEESAVDEEEIYRRIKTCHRRYVDLIKYTRLYNACMSPLMLLYMFVCTIMLCVTAYQFTEESSALRGLMLGEYLLFGVSQLLFYCWHSNEVIFASKDLMQGPYESRWWSSDVSRQKEICMLIHQFRETIVFTAGPFTDLTLATFINIIKGAYSYYTILKQSKNQ
ncbi:odorant receptor 43a [Papilio machaon]|uniref:odorant receptor 43a n=1 Tax=Papilio machaon TaxID=76193 RepID=UPI001E663BA1|nr:odorant receptor 43a [Papilio machaon]